MPINVNRLLGLPDTAAYATQLAAEDICQVLLVKGGERYVFLYTESKRDAAICTFLKFALCPELSFSMQDADDLTAQVMGEV